MIGLKKIGFHEATVIRFCRYESTVELELEDVLVGEIKSKILFIISSVSMTIIDGVLLNDTSLFMEADDGEIIELNVERSNIFMIIEWNNFSKKISFTKSYKIFGDIYYNH